MIDLSKVNEIYLYTGTTDFRYGIYGLSRLVLNQFQRDEIKHNLYLFCSKSKKCIKILEFEENGVWMYYKKLDVGKYIYLLKTSRSGLGMISTRVSQTTHGVKKTNCASIVVQLI